METNFPVVHQGAVSCAMMNAVDQLRMRQDDLDIEMSEIMDAHRGKPMNEVLLALSKKAAAKDKLMRQEHELLAEYMRLVGRKMHP